LVAGVGAFLKSTQNLMILLDLPYENLLRFAGNTLALYNFLILLKDKREKYLKISKKFLDRSVAVWYI
jgi:hypothetical protein